MKEPILFVGGLCNGQTHDVALAETCIMVSPKKHDFHTRYFEETYRSELVNGKLQYSFESSQDVTDKLRESWAKFRHESMQRVLDAISGADDE